ncbi:hypothetical protein EG328_005865 [Venturia inaequalis]|uniref:Uncharacterized protein n=1 Tax=Venturia inaequalis TaxID=5025 RepID=A0A8H3Z959_VENIN|nr:hypothetical protein EG328_005865 [Venturia inaequalis]KAE9990790.1 hypothetical protein EG327_000937 [Venturia inaequalis]
MASLDRTKLEKLPQHIQRTIAEYTSHELLQLRDALTHPPSELLSLSQEMKDKTHHLIIVHPPVISPPTTKRPLQYFDYDSPKSIMRMRVSKLHEVEGQCLLSHERRVTLTCTSLLGDGNNWFDPGSNCRQAISKLKIRNLRLNIIFYPTDAQQNDAFFSPAAKLRQIIGMFQLSDGQSKPLRPPIRVHIAFIQSENLDGHMYRNDVLQFPTTVQRMVQEALVAVREMIEEENINMCVKSNGDVLFHEGEGSIISQHESFGECIDPPPYSRF